MLRFLLRKAGKAIINMPTVNSIRQQRRDGFSISDIAKMNGVSRDTVYKYLAQDDFSPRPPARRSAPSKLDPYKPIIRQWLEDDARNWRKQRHTATGRAQTGPESP